VNKTIRKSHKFISLLLALSLNGAGIALAEEDIKTEINYDEFTYNSAAILTSALSGEALFEGEPEKTVTRGEFVNAVEKLFNISGSSLVEVPYKDVTAENKYYDAICVAYDNGWISSGENFYPEKEILYPEALKIMFHAADYEIFVERYGTYPSGYLSMAAKMEILDDVRVGVEQTINTANAQILLYNLLHADASEISYFEDGNPVYGLGPDTNLESLYEVSYFDGIVTSTGCNSIIMDDEINLTQSTVSIDGEQYLSEWLSPELLGKRVRAYYYDEVAGDKKLCCVTEKENKNEEQIIAVKDFGGISDSRLYYYEKQNRKKSLKLEESYRVIYNGRRVSKLEDYMIENNAKSIRLLSNDGDSEYEMIFIDGYTYGYVTGINNFDEEIGIKLPGETLYLDAGNESTVKKIYDSNGKEIELFELTKDVVVGVKKSADGRLYEIRVCEDTVYGKVVSVDKEEALISLSKKEYVDNRELDARYEEKITTYEMSNEFISEYLEKIKSGDELSAILGLDGEIVYLNSGASKLVYGYLQNVYLSRDKGEEEYYLRILEMNGEFGKYKLAKKVTVDGASKKNIDAFNVLRKDFSPQVVKYSYNSDGEITVVDLASMDTSEYGKQPENSRNSLVKFYSKSDTALRYRAGCRGFSSVGLLLNAQILFVPNDAELLNDSENYSIGDYNTMISDNTYSVELFNIDEYGMVEFAAVYINAKTPPQEKSLQSCIISKIYTAYDNETGEMGREIVCRYNDAFKTYFIPDYVKIKKNSGTELCEGDIIRVYEDMGVVRNIFVDYDFSSGKHIFEESSSAQELETGNASLVFVKGKLFSQGSSSYVLSDTTHDGVIYDYSYDNLRPYYATGNIILFDTETKEIRNISKSELKTYQGYGDDCDYAIIRQNYTSPSVMFIIR